MSVLRWLAEDDRKMTGAIMTTFPFSPGFFEQSVMPALRAKQSEFRPAVLMDSEQYSELLDYDENPQGANRSHPTGLGQSYHVSPIEPPENRTFHPKIIVLTSPKRVQVAIGSMNTTHPGMTSNRELVTQFELTKDPDAAVKTGRLVPLSNGDETTRYGKAQLYLQTGEFLEDLLDSPFASNVDSVTRRSIEETLSEGDWVRDLEIAQEPSPTTTLLHSLEEPILEQVFDRITARGEEVEQVDIVAPFYGTSIRVPEYFTEREIDTTLWLQEGRTQISLDQLASWTENNVASAVTYDDVRYVHGKLLCLKTGEAAYCVSGSPNASQAAQLSSTTTGGNIEVAVFCRRTPATAFDDLINRIPFNEHTPLDLESFTAADVPNRFDSPATDSDITEPPLVIYEASYFRRQSFDGGRLQITGRATSELRATAEGEGAELRIRHPGQDTISTLSLASWGFEWANSSEDGEFTFQQKLASTENKTLSQAGIVEMGIQDEVSNQRWIQVHTPAPDAPTDEEITNSGTTAVPERVFQLYNSDQDTETQIVSTLSTLLQGIKNRESGPTSSGSTVGNSGPSGGLNLSSWSSSTDVDSGEVLESFLDGWKDDIRSAIKRTNSTNPLIEDVGQRLQAINSVCLQLLILDATYPERDVPKQSVVNSINDVYTKTDRSDNVTSLLGDFYYNLRLDRADPETQSDLFDSLESEVVPNLVFAAVVTEEHLAESVETHHKRHGWAFELLLGQSYPAGHPGSDHLKEMHLEELVDQLQRHTESVRSQIQNSNTLIRHASHRYLEEKGLRDSVIELLGRSVLYAGPDAIQEIRNADGFNRALNQVFDTHTPYLPPDKRRSVQDIL